MKAIVIDESRNLVRQDVPDPVCHDEFDVKLAFESGRFAPFIHKVLPITEAAEAHRIMVAGENRGKIVMTV